MAKVFPRVLVGCQLVREGSGLLSVSGWGMGSGSPVVLHVSRWSVAVDNVQAYMWFAVVGGDGHMKQVARHMTRSQILQAQRTAEDSITKHSWKEPANIITPPTTLATGP